MCNCLNVKQAKGQQNQSMPSYETGQKIPEYSAQPMAWPGLRPHCRTIKATLRRHQKEARNLGELRSRSTSSATNQEIADPMWACQTGHAVNAFQGDVFSAS